MYKNVRKKNWTPDVGLTILRSLYFHADIIIKGGKKGATEMKFAVSLLDSAYDNNWSLFMRTPIYAADMRHVQKICER